MMLVTIVVGFRLRLFTDLHHYLDIGITGGGTDPVNVLGL